MRFMKPLAAVLALGLTAVSFTGTAEARHRHHGGDALAAGIVGFAAGAIVSGALSQPRYYEPAPYYYEPQPVYVAPPAPVYYQQPAYYQPAQAYYGRPQPWSAEWYDYCNQRYRSFDDRTGYFLGFDGQYHFCQ